MSGFIKPFHEAKGLITRYPKDDGLSKMFDHGQKTGRLVRKQRTSPGFQLKYLREETLLLAALDERHVNC